MVNNERKFRRLKRTGLVMVVGGLLGTAASLTYGGLTDEVPEVVNNYRQIGYDVSALERANEEIAGIGERYDFEGLSGAGVGLDESIKLLSGEREKIKRSDRYRAGIKQEENERA